MRPQNQVSRLIQMAALALLVASLPACQKVKNSSVQRPQPQPQYPTGYPPVPPPRYIPPGPMVPVPSNPGIVVPPTFPPGGFPTTPVPTLPPRVTPPSEVPAPAAPVTPGEPTVTPLPSTPTTPITPGVTNPPVTTPLPVVVVTPTEPTPIYTQPVYPAPSQPQPTPVGGTPVVITAPTPITPSPGLVTPAPAIPVGPSTGSSIQVGRPVLPSAGLTQPIAGSATGVVVTPVAGSTVSPGLVSPLPILSEQPSLPSGVRIQTPIRSDILSTCRGADCLPRHQVYTPTNPPTSALDCPPIQLNPTPVTNKVDVLFVVDTSASMKEERVEIARQMTKYLEQLPHDAEYRIAVMLGHGPRSKTGVVGELFTPPSKSPTVQYGVIQVKDLIEAKRAQLNPANRAANGRAPLPGNGQDFELVARQEGAKLAADRLVEMMKNVPNDASETQGEAGLLNLYTAVSDPRKLQEMKRRGFWNDDAAKTVVFVADENDVCFDYDKHGLKGHYATDSDRRSEIDAFNRTDVCAATANGQRLTPEHVYYAVKNSSRMPVSFAGILYLDNKSIPQKNDKYAKDNEMGHGYLDVIAQGFGQAADLGQANFGGALARIGHYSKFKMAADHIFPMEGVKNVSDIDPYSVRVVITDPNGQAKTFNATNVKLEIDAANNRARVVIAYDILAQVYDGGEIQRGSKVQIHYQLKSGAAAPSASTAAPAAATPSPQPAAQEDRSLLERVQDILF